MQDVEFAMEFPDVLGNFEQYSRSYCSACAAVTILIDSVVLLQLVARKFPRHGTKFNSVIVFSLVTCDLIYEIATTSLLLQSNSCEAAKNCKTLHFIYMTFNLSTVFHIILAILEKMMVDFGWGSHPCFASSVLCSVIAWVSACGLACVDLKNENGLIDKGMMEFLVRFKAFGYLLFVVVLCSAILVFLLTVCVEKPDTKAPSEFQLPLAIQKEIRSGSRVLQEDDIVYSCMFMATFVGWCAWVILGVDSRIMKTVEVMKSFEVTRLGARIMNPLTFLYSLSYNNEYSRCASCK